MNAKSGTDKICICGSTFYVQAYRAEAAQYCSRKCAGLGRPKRQKTGVNATCSHCGASYYVRPYRAPDTLFCSRRCIALAKLPQYAEKRLAAATAANKARASLTPKQVKANKKALDARWYAANKDRANERGSRYYVENKDQIRAVNKAWREANAEKVTEANRLKRQRDGERIREKRRHHYRDNKAAYIANARNREAAKRLAMPSWADRDRIKEFYVEAARMTAETGNAYVVDHVVPLQGKNVCGLHTQDNLQVITELENTMKSNRWEGS